MMNKILFFGPIAPPFNGQSIAFTEFYKSVKSTDKILIDFKLRPKNLALKIIFSLFIVLKILLVFVFKKPTAVYFTCSRSVLGSVRDVALINIADLYRVPIITHLHGADFKLFYNNIPIFYQKIIKNTYLKVDKAIVLSEKMQSEFSMFPHLKTQVVANFFVQDKNYCMADYPIKKKQNDAIQLLFLSNLMKAKGILLLLDAFAQINQQYPHIKLNIAGEFIADNEMSEKEISRQFHLKLKKMKNVNYLGVVTGKRKTKLLKQADLLVLPTHHRSEALPLSIIEAMAYGCVILTTKHNYLADIISHKNGLLIKPNSKTALIEGLILMIEKSANFEKIGKHNCKLANKKYSLESYINALTKIVFATHKP